MTATEASFKAGEPWISINGSEVCMARKLAMQMRESVNTIAD